MPRLVMLAALIAAYAQPACADIILDLATPDPGDPANQPQTTAGTINGAIFGFGQLPAGTGNWQPFVRIQGGGSSSTQQGYNTDGGTPWDTKSGNWTHSVKVGDLPVVTIGNTTYIEYLVDINEGQSANGERISLDQFQIFQGPSGSVSAESTAGLGTLVYDMDAGMPGNTVLMNTFNAGSGNADYSVLVPVWDGVDTDQFMTLYTSWGAYSDPGGINYESDSGFEEWAFSGNRAPLSSVPEPASGLALAGMLLGGAFYRRRQVS